MLQHVVHNPEVEPERGPRAADPMAVEEWMTRTWASLLGRGNVEPTDDFFALGGTDILAGRLFRRMRDQLGAALPVSVLLRDRTVRQLSERVVRSSAADRNGASAREALVVVREGAGGPPLIYVPPAGASVLSCLHLAGALDGRRPIWAFQPAGLGDGCEPADTVEAMADEYLAALERVDPAGPYIVTGHCFGGLVALEIAHRLGRKGAKVPLVAIFDTVYTPVRSKSAARGQALGLRLRARLMGSPLARRAQYYGRRILRLGSTGQLGPALLRKLVARIGWGRPATSQAPVGAAGLALDDDGYTLTNRPFPEVRAAHMRARGRYLAKPYPGRLALFRSGIGSRRASRRGWRRIVSGRFDCTVVGEAMHMNLLLRPHVEVVAGALEEYLTDALS